MSVVPNLSQSSPGVPIYAPVSGGGGGGSGPNPAVSTLTFNDPGLVVFGSELDFAATATVGSNDYKMSAGISDAAIVSGFGGSGQANVLTCYSPLNGGMALNIGACDSQPNILASVITSSGLPSSLYLVADTITVPYNLNVSSINGVAPSGGGVNPNLNVSTLTTAQYIDVENTTDVSNKLRFNTVNASTFSILPPSGSSGGILIARAPNVVTIQNADLQVSSINGLPPGGGGAAISTFPNLTVSSGVIALGGTLTMAAEDVNLYAFRVFDSNVSSMAAFSLGTIGGRNQFSANVGEISAFYTSTITGTTGQIALNPSGTEQIRIGGLGAPGDITINTVGGGNIILNGPTSAPLTASISSLTVSSINGVPPGGGNVSKIAWVAGSIQLSTLMTPGVPNILTSASAALQNNHTYRVTACFGLSNAKDDGQTTISVEGTWGGLPASLASYANQVISTPANFVGGYSGYFTTNGGAGGGITIGGTNTGSANTTIIGDNAYVLVEDLGAI